MSNDSEYDKAVAGIRKYDEVAKTHSHLVFRAEAQTTADLMRWWLRTYRPEGKLENP